MTYHYRIKALGHLLRGTEFKPENNHMLVWDVYFGNSKKASLLSLEEMRKRGIVR